MIPGEHKSPFKFLDSFTQADSDIFFGRDQEVEELYAKIFQSQVMLVYGASGTGKSSIVNCGLANRFRTSDWLPINIRRGGNMLRSMRRQIERESVGEIIQPEGSGVTPEDFHRMLSSVFLDHFKPIYLIFDQFEELFIFGREEEWREFIDTLRYLMDTDLDVHFIFVIRGEYLEFLSVFEEDIPDFFDNRVRIEKMTRRNAESIISGPARLYSINLDDGFEETLLKKISPDKAHVELTFLQVFLDRIYRKALEQQTGEGPLMLRKQQIEDVGQIGDVLAEFVDEQLLQMDRPKEALTILKAFVSLQGTKTQMKPEEVERYTTTIGNPVERNTIDAILSEFVNRRILKEKDDNGKYELRHDSLAQKIHEKITHQERELLDVQQFLAFSVNEFRKRGIMLNDQDLSYLSPFERILNLDEETRDFIRVSRNNSTKQKKSRRTRNIIGVVILILSITSVMGFFYSQSQRKKAEEMAQVASNETEEAKKQRLIAEQQEKAAQEQAAIANEEREKATEAREEAIVQQQEAVRQKGLAEVQRTQAEQARLVADQNANDAMVSQRMAEEERKNATRLRMLGLVRELSVKAAYMSDRELKTLLALQALDFNKKYGGNKFNSDLYQALYLAKQSYAQPARVGVSTHTLAITQLISHGDWMISCGQDGRVVRADLLNSLSEELITESGYLFNCLAYSGDGKSIWLGTQSGKLIHVDAVSGKVDLEKDVEKSPIIALFEYAGQVFIVAANGNVVISDKKGEAIRELAIGQPIADASIDVNVGSLWVVNNRNELVEISDGKINRRLKVQESDKIKKIAVGSNGTVAIGFENGIVGLFDLEKQSLVQKLVGHIAAITGLAFDRGGTYLASASYDRSVRIWKTDQLQEPPIVLPYHDNWVSAVAFGPNGQVVSGTYSGTLSSYTLELDQLAIGLCNQVGRRMTRAEWEEYIGNDVRQVNPCVNE